MFMSLVILGCMILPHDCSALHKLNFKVRFSKTKVNNRPGIYKMMVNKKHVLILKLRTWHMLVLKLLSTYM